MSVTAVRFVEVDPRPTAVVAETTTWSEFPELWGRLGVTHEAVREHVAAQGRELAGPGWEIYGQGRPDPSEPETEVSWLLR